MKTGPDISTIYRIARYYYAEGLSQEEIAAKEGFSRSQISRLIERAKSLGLVKITLVPPASQHTEELSEMLVKKLGIRTAVVVPVGKSANQEEITRAIATRAADFLEDELPAFKVAGIGWGKTVYETAMLLPRRPEKTGKPFFVPLIGLSGDTNPNLQINTIIDRFSTSFQSKGLFVNLSSVREKESALSSIEEQRIHILREYWDQVEAAVVGLGIPPSSSINIIDELPEQYKEELKKSASCGDILSQFFDQNGAIFHSEYEYDLLAFDIRNLPNLQRSICLAGGELKARGIVAAARSGFISDLITDEQTAHAILMLLREHSAEGQPKKTQQGAAWNSAATKGERT
jgi:DNA-binding transcriptional regulator LsrR (DeoR family)